MKDHLIMRLTLITGFLLLGTTIFAQNFTSDALLLSRQNVNGSARVQALGGSHVSLGGDYSSAFANPAGLGMYNRSEVTLSLGVNSYKNNVNYFNTETRNSNSNINLPGLSVVLNYNRTEPKPSGFLGGSLGISLTRTTDLNQRVAYTADNSESSIVDFFVDDAFNYVGSDVESMLRDEDNYFNLTALAYNNYLIDTFRVNGQYGGYYSVLDTIPGQGETRTLKQAETIKRKGAQYQWSFAYGANFSDKFFVGGAIGITTIRYKLSQSFRESDFLFTNKDGDTSRPPVDYFESNEQLDIQGSGVNLSVGFIYRPIDFFQFGANIVTPTLYQLTDNYSAGMKSHWNDTNEDIEESFPEALLSEYNLTTPFRVSGGLTFISKYGFITGSVESVNYGRAKYSSDIAGITYDDDNKSIKSAYGKAINYRIGAEFRYEMFRLRGGYSVMGDPYRSSNEIDRKITSITMGAGVRLKKFFGDIALVNTKTNGLRIPYYAPTINDPRADITFKNTNVVMTFGFTF